jgi:hypothetical protein
VEAHIEVLLDLQISEEGILVQKAWPSARESEVLALGLYENGFVGPGLQRLFIKKFRSVYDSGLVRGCRYGLLPVWWSQDSCVLTVAPSRLLMAIATLSKARQWPVHALHGSSHAMSTLKHHVITTLMILSCVFAGCAQQDQYIAAALEHADRAITNGQGRDNNALAEQATVALRYAWLAERNNKDGRLLNAIRLLKEGIDNARYGRSDAGVQAVEEAYKLLAELQ